MILSRSGNLPLKLGLGAIAFLTVAFLVIPMLFIIALSLGDSRWMGFPPPGFLVRFSFHREPTGLDRRPARHRAIPCFP